MVGKHRENLMGVRLVWGFWATASFILALSLEIQVNPTIRVGKKSTLNPIQSTWWPLKRMRGDATREAWLIFLMVYWWAVYISILRPASFSKILDYLQGFFCSYLFMFLFPFTAKLPKRVPGTSHCSSQWNLASNPSVLLKEMGSRG